MRVMIGVPAGRGMMSYTTVMTIVDICRLMSARGIEYDFTCYSYAEVAVARNFLASAFLDGQCDTFIGIDDDVGVKAAVIEQLLDADVDYIGAYLPQRRIDLTAFENAVASGKRGKNAQFAAAPFVGVGANPTNPEYGTFGKVDFIGTGFFILKRKVLDAIIEKDLAVKSLFKTVSFERITYGFYDNIRDDDGDLLSEDFSFCDRVRRAGFDIHAYLGPGISHTGTMTFES